MSYYRTGGIDIAELVNKAVDKAKQKIRDEAAQGAKVAVAPVARREAAEGARSAVMPLVIGVGAVSLLSLIVALKK